MCKYLFDRDAKNCFGVSPINLKLSTKAWLVTNFSSSVYTQRLGNSWNHKDKSHFGVSQNIHHTIDTIITRTVWNEQGFVSFYCNKSCRITFW